MLTAIIRLLQLRRPSADQRCWDNSHHFTSATTPATVKPACIASAAVSGSGRKAGRALVGLQYNCIRELRRLRVVALDDISLRSPKA